MIECIFTNKKDLVTSVPKEQMVKWEYCLFLKMQKKKPKTIKLEELKLNPGSADTDELVAH